MNDQANNSNENGRAVSDNDEKSSHGALETQIDPQDLSENAGNGNNAEVLLPTGNELSDAHHDGETRELNHETMSQFGPAQSFLPVPPPLHPFAPNMSHFANMVSFPPPPPPQFQPPNFSYGPPPPNYYPTSPYHYPGMRDQALAWANMAAMYANAAQVASQAAAECAALESTNNSGGDLVEEKSWKPDWNGDQRHKKRGQDDDNRRNSTRRRQRWLSSDSSSSGGSWRRPPAKKKAISLLGKTGVSALFEWSSKRHITPTLTVQHDRERDEFECIVYLPASKSDKEVLQEWGRGRGRSKAVAKQEAARNAVTALVPGVKFDSNTGVIIVLPYQHSTNHLANELPTLTKGLAIDRDSNYENKRARDNTTSEEDSESAYIAREGGSVCSHLLHTMIQIDPERLPTAPVFVYESSSRGNPFKCTGHLETRDDLLSAVGMGLTKREARHAVSARLLALLFPQCSDMAAVQEAAEEMREEYAKSRVLKQAAQANKRVAPEGEATDDDEPASGSDKRSSDVKHAIETKEESLNLQEKSVEEDLVSSVSAVALNEPSTKPKRRKCMDEFGRALLMLTNNKAIPDGCEDVGRTILRRAEPADLPRIFKLFSDNTTDSTAVTPPPLDDFSERSSRPLHVVLLLCRAIAVYEDPPLGCAILSKEADDRLRLVQVATEHHLPEERFLECIEDFATCMKCTLEPKTTDILLDSNEIGNIVGLGHYEGSNPGHKVKLQSVLEGSEEESAEEARSKKRGEVSSKVPSKRSRVQ